MINPVQFHVNTVNVSFIKTGPHGSVVSLIKTGPHGSVSVNEACFVSLCVVLCCLQSSARERRRRRKEVDSNALSESVGECGGTSLLCDCVSVEGHPDCVAELLST